MRIVIIHFSPLELYPPVQNLLQILGDRIEVFNVRIISTTHHHRSLTTYTIDDDRFTIVRHPHVDPRSPILGRFTSYVRFYVRTIIDIVAFRPQRILYFETLSSFPAYFYKRFINTGVEVLLHYHEYTSKNEYRDGMRLVKFCYGLEKWLYPKAAWVSHTNLFRLQKFREDVRPIPVCRGNVLPNYPPKHWSSQRKRDMALPLRVVYIGALSLQTMYVKEFADWVLGHSGKVMWTIFSHNCTDDARHYINQLDARFITLKEGVNYQELPKVLMGNHIGVVLYKGHIPNYVYNAPNKLFEYLACGLSVLFPHVMIGSLEYVNTKSYPQVISADFENLRDVHPEDLLSTEGLDARENSYYAEAALEPLVLNLLRQ